MCKILIMLWSTTTFLNAWIIIPLSGPQKLVSGKRNFAIATSSHYYRNTFMGRRLGEYYGDVSLLVMKNLTKWDCFWMKLQNEAKHIILFYLIIIVIIIRRRSWHKFSVITECAVWDFSFVDVCGQNPVRLISVIIFIKKTVLSI